MIWCARAARAGAAAPGPCRPALLRSARRVKVSLRTTCGIRGGTYGFRAGLQLVDACHRLVALLGHLVVLHRSFPRSDLGLELLDLRRVLLDHHLVRHELHHPSSQHPPRIRRNGKRRTSPRSALVTTILARRANLSVESVSVACSASGEMVQMTATRELPDSAGWSSRVSFESRYGMCGAGPFALRLSVSFPITVPSVRRLRRWMSVLLASRKLSWNVPAVDERALLEPLRLTRRALTSSEIDQVLLPAHF